MKTFDKWIDELAKPATVMVRMLTEDADAERGEFNSQYDGGNCSCHISPPCGSCTHPGNPMNQDEDETAWRMVPEDQVP